MHGFHGRQFLPTHIGMGNVEVISTHSMHGAALKENASDIKKTENNLLTLIW